MKILVTNDDGIYSPGLSCLARVASAFGEVIVMAPDVEQSSMGQAITSGKPITYKKSPIHFENMKAYRVNGTPADCVALGTHLYEDIDLVLSGINIGSNLGNSAWHSGTLSAARQAVLFEVRGIALSVSVGDGETDFDALEPFVMEALKEVIHENVFQREKWYGPPNLYGIMTGSSLPIKILWEGNITGSRFFPLNPKMKDLTAGR